VGGDVQRICREDPGHGALAGGSRPAEQEMLKRSFVGWVNPALAGNPTAFVGFHFVQPNLQGYKAGMA